MNPLFWLSLALTAGVFYHVGKFITLRELKSSADELLAQMEIDMKRIKLAQAKSATQALEDNSTGSPIGASLAREMGIEL